MRNFVTKFDYEDETIELRVNANAPAGITVDFKLTTWQIFGVVVACLVFIAIVAWLIICCCKRQKRQALKRNYQVAENAKDFEEEIISEEQRDNEEGKKLVQNDAKTNSAFK